MKTHLSCYNTLSYTFHLVNVLLSEHFHEKGYDTSAFLMKMYSQPAYSKLH